MSYITTKIRNGTLDEYEDNRTDHRIKATVMMLDGMGAGIGDAVKAARAHAEDCDRHPDRLYRVAWSYRATVACTCGADHRKPELPEWLLDDHIDAAYNLVDSMIVARASTHHAAIANRR